MKKEYDFTRGKRGAVLSIPRGKTRITIRIDDDVLDWFRNQVHQAGGGSYQTLINLALREHIARDSQRLEETLKHVLREELSRYDMPRLGSPSAIASTLGELGPQVQAFLSPERIDQELILTFFMVFARAEFALKRQRDFVEERRDHSFKIRWDKFAQAIGSGLWHTASKITQRGLDYLKSHPPRRQVVRNGILCWEPLSSEQQTSPMSLLRSIRTVRNNLFHGGKEVQWLMAERDRRLIESSLVVLAHCITLNKDVHQAFLDMPPEDVAA
jgi:BrnA antitoxin of type II toxin-antitoxin system